MAYTDTNSNKVLSTDIYEISDFIDQIRSNNITDLDETASMVGIFGYMNEIFGQTLQNTLIEVSESSNETIPTKAKFSKNVIAHALNYGITKIMSQPATMTLMIYMPISYIETNFVELDSSTGTAKFIFDKNVPIFVDEYEFHLDYDIIFKRVKSAKDGKYVYTAMYDLFESGTTVVKQQNPISDITNPYITTLVQMTIDGVDYLAFSARLHQVTINQYTTTILTNNDIENKTVTFQFEDQLCSFDVDVEENDITTHLTPIYSGLIDNTVTSNWCNYQYLDENTIRIIFDKDSYIPGMNAKVTVNIQSSEGSNGNFVYNNNFRASMRSDKYNNYNGMYILVYPLLDGTSTGGKDKKSIKDLKKIIPREASSRGAIINTTDLQNFFNSINDEECKLYFSKKRDNPFERLYYAHMVMRKNSNVYPTNTISLKLLQDDFNGYSGNNNLSINPGTIFYYYDHRTDPENDYATIEHPKYIDSNPDITEYHTTLNAIGEEVRVFEYISPFLISIDDDLITSYLLTIMNENKLFQFDKINTASPLQFVSTNMNWRRKFIYEDENGDKQIYDNKYVMTVSMTQNDNNDYKLIKYHNDEDGNMVFDDDPDKMRVKMFMVLYADETANTPYRYIEGSLKSYNRSNFIYDFEFVLETDDLMDLNNRINIKGIYNAGDEEFQKKDQMENAHGYLNNNTYAKIYILADFGTREGDIVDGVTVTKDNEKIVLYGEDGIGNRTELESILPIRDNVVDKFLKNELYIELDDQSINVVNIIKSNPEYIKIIKEYNNDENETETAILRYLNNNRDSDFVKNVLLADERVNEVIDSYNYVDLNRYTLCNVMNVSDGVDFYYDYSNMMTSVVNIAQIQKTTEDGKPLFREITRTDSLGNDYKEYQPIWMVNKDNTYFYSYKINRIPVIKNGFLSSEDDMEDFIYDLEERRKYINVCLYVLEDTFGIDLKFFNTFGPSKRFYYNIPSATSYKVKVTVDTTNILSKTDDEDNPDNIVGSLDFGEEVLIIKTKGQWGYIEHSYKGNIIKGWIKISNTTKCVNYINNVGLTMNFALQAQTSADKYISNNIISDIKEYIEDINELSELHVPNIITLITNNYREQLVYFEFLDVNGYGPSCQHLYYDDTIDVDTCPEFLNIAMSNETEEPEINIAVY